MKRIFFILLFMFLIMSIIQVQESNNKLKTLFHDVDKAIDIQNNNSIRIAISSSNYDDGSMVSENYIKAVKLAGGEPIIIPSLTEASALIQALKDVHGLVMISGIDVYPSYYDQEAIDELGESNELRDIYDLTLTKLAANRNIPILAICRGEQVLNMAFGGTLFQDISSQAETDIVHLQNEKDAPAASHLIKIEKGSKLAALMKADTITTNSYHHQSIDKVAPNFRIAARSKDGIIEAIEGYPHRKIMAVQWHPEVSASKGDTMMLKLFDNLIEDAKTYKKAIELHHNILTIDSHVDTPLRFNKDGYNISSRDKHFVNLPKMIEGHLDAVFMVAYIGQGERDKKSSEEAVKHIFNMLNKIRLQTIIHSKSCGLATNKEELIQLKKQGRKAFFMGVENGYGIGKDLSNLKIHYDLGVRYMTLCHTKDNDICDTSSQTKNEWGGLSPFGKEVIKEMNRLGMIIDISHVGVNTFNDVIELSTKPIIASHSSVKSLCNHNRNLTDEQIRAIAKNNGVIQVCMVNSFINSNNTKASLEDGINHIDYIVNLVGVDHVGIGSDFDGGGRLIGLEGANDMLNITIKLIEKGYSNEDIKKIWGDNLLRVLEAQ